MPKEPFTVEWIRDDTIAGWECTMRVPYGDDEVVCKTVVLDIEFTGDREETAPTKAAAVVLRWYADALAAFRKGGA